MKRAIWLLCILTIAIAVGFACTSDETPSESTSAPAAPAPTATAPAAPAPAISAPTPAQPSTEVTTSVTVTVSLRSNIAGGAWLQRNGNPESAYYLGITECLFNRDPDNVTSNVGMLANTWDLAEDLSKVTITLKEGIQFHDDWGELTARDVVWSMNDANNAITPESIHGQAGDFASLFNEWTEVDKYTFDANFNTFDATWQKGFLNCWYESLGFSSLKVFEDLGAEAANTTRIGTGPFKVADWVQDDKIVTEAVEDHWRITPQIAGYTLIGVSEESVRVAMMQTGETDIGQIRVLRNVAPLEGEGIEFHAGTDEAQQPNILFGGNYWEKTHFKTGEPVERAGLDPSLPWIGDPDDADSMEQARKVRWALALAIDREAIVETVLGGKGAVNELPWISVRDKEWIERKDKWSVGYDPERAKAMLAEAGYPDGFDLEVYDTVIYGPQEVFEAVSGFWRDDIGVNASIDLTAYATRRPSIVTREINVPWISGCNYGRHLPPDWPKGALASTLSRGGFGCGFEASEFADFYIRSAAEADPAKRFSIQEELYDFNYHWMLVAGTVEVPVLWAYSPETIESWDLKPAFKGQLNSLDRIVPVEP